MTALFVVAMFLGFILLDVAVRRVHARAAAARARTFREAVLATSLRLDFSDEAPSLKRVEVPVPRARILAVDDEAVVLDSLRKVLVLAGYSVDTVENGPEALGLLRKRDYDFLFTDLKMPGMDGVEVVRAARHLRPDTDVAVITGYGTIETAVATVREGALDYVQKPFTEDELLQFVERLLVRRQARVEAEQRPSVRILSPAACDRVAEPNYAVPGGYFVSPGHVWVRVESDGRVRIGLDDFARKAIRNVGRITVPAPGTNLGPGALLARLELGLESLDAHTPLEGKIVEVNEALVRHPTLLLESPYEDGFLCVVAPNDLHAALAHLRIGRAAALWYQDEIDRLRRHTGDVSWSWFGPEFLSQSATQGAVTV